MNNIFIEGIQGSGKSTLLNKLSKKMPEYKVYREGDLSPVELAWCSYMTNQQYEDVCTLYKDILDDMKAHTVTEESRKITAYTQIITDIQGFHVFMEKYEIYNGKVKYKEFKEIILKRYSDFNGVGNIFECSFFQNSIECMMLFYKMSENEIIEFYQNAYEILKHKNFKMLYLEVQDMENTIDTIKRERTDTQGNELWFQMMCKYIEESPYGKEHHIKDFDGLIFHLNRRKEIEHNIVEKVIGKDAFVVTSKNYEIGNIINWCEQ